MEQTILSQLNDEQKKAVDIVYNNAIITAGPGTGKTRTIIAHCYNLVKNYQVDPKQILSITFTRKAASELKDRLNKEGVNGVDARTIDSLTLQIIKEAYKLLPNKFDGKTYTKNIKPLTSDDGNLMQAYLNIINQVYDELERDYRDYLYNLRLDQQKEIDFNNFNLNDLNLAADLDTLFTPNDSKKNFAIFNDLVVKNWSDERINEYAALSAQHSIENYLNLDDSNSDNKLLVNDEALTDLFERFYNVKLFGTNNNWRSYFNSIQQKLINTYLKYCQNHSVMTHTQILYSVLTLIDPKSENFNQDLLLALKHKYQFINVDEYQDTSNMQVRFIYLISNGHTFAVGDPNQSIYGFRGANSTTMSNFGNIFENTQAITLHQTYRSSQNILRLVNAIENTDLVTNKQAGLKPQYLEFSNDANEYNAIIMYLKRLVMRNVKLSDIAILARTNRSLNSFKKALKATKGEFKDLNIMTVHASKGLEFKYVIVLDLAQDLFPLTWVDNDPAEELRLFYVAASRAIEHLVLCSVEFTFNEKRNEWDKHNPSSFLERSQVKDTLNILDLRDN